MATSEQTDLDLAWRLTSTAIAALIHKMPADTMPGIIPFMVAIEAVDQLNDADHGTARAIIRLLACLDERLIPAVLAAAAKYRKELGATDQAERRRHLRLIPGGLTDGDCS